MWCLARTGLPRPTFDEVLAAPEARRLNLLVCWLQDADANRTGRMAEALRQKNQLSNHIWTALAWRWAEVDADAALSFARFLVQPRLDAASVEMALGFSYFSKP